MSSSLEEVKRAIAKVEEEIEKVEKEIEALAPMIEEAVRKDLEPGNDQEHWRDKKKQLWKKYPQVSLTAF